MQTIIAVLIFGLLVAIVWSILGGLGDIVARFLWHSIPWRPERRVLRLATKFGNVPEFVLTGTFLGCVSIALFILSLAVLAIIGGIGIDLMESYPAVLFAILIPPVVLILFAGGQSMREQFSPGADVKNGYARRALQDDSFRKAQEIGTALGLHHERINEVSTLGLDQRLWLNIWYLMHAERVIATRPPVPNSDDIRKRARKCVEYLNTAHNNTEILFDRQFLNESITKYEQTFPSIPVFEPDSENEQNSENCPRGHGKLASWEGKPRCWTCGWPDR